MANRLALFQSARVKLTAWYVGIIMLVSLVFSGIIFIGINSELHRIELAQRLRHDEQAQIVPKLAQLNRERMAAGLPPVQFTYKFSEYSNQNIVQARLHILSILGAINLTIVSIAAALGYFLAGRTLRPIATMVAEQNRFISDASHEFRTPLTALKTMIEVKLRDKNLKVEDARKLLRSNLDDINNLQKLTDRLLLLAQFEKPNTLQLEQVTLKEIADKAISQIAPLAKAKQIGITNDVATVPVMVDKPRMTEVLTTLLDNAVKYSPEKAEIRMSVRKTDGHVLLTVSDTGAGISAQDLPHIFDRFYRADLSRTHQTVTGFGLGLSIAKEIIEAHNGSISVKSRLGKGTTFTIKLPIA